MLAFNPADNLGFIEDQFSAGHENRAADGFGRHAQKMARLLRFGGDETGDDRRLAAENFAFQDFPIILASFGLSNAECDR